jgi:subtilisin
MTYGGFMQPECVSKIIKVWFLSLAGDNATIGDNTFAFFSNFGPLVKIAAPGVNIISTYNGTGYAVHSGTSMAAPHVSGAATLYNAQHPYTMPSEVMDAVLGAWSLLGILCDEGAHGHFTGDADNLPEPLLYKDPPSSSAITPVVSRPTR